MRSLNSVRAVVRATPAFATCLPATCLVAMSVLVAPCIAVAQSVTVTLAPQSLELQRTSDGRLAAPAVAKLQVGYTDARSSCVKVTRVVAVEIGASVIPTLLATHDLPNGGECSWSPSSVTMSIEPFETTPLPSCGRIVTPQVVVMLMAPKSPTVESIATDAYNSVLTQVLGGSSQGCTLQYATVASRVTTLQGHVECGGGSGSSTQSGSAAAPVHQAHPVGSSAGTGSGGTVHSASAVGGAHGVLPPGGSSSPPSSSGSVHSSRAVAPLSLSVPQFAGACPTTINAQATYQPAAAGTAAVTWKFGDGASTTSQLPVRSGSNTISLSQRVTASRNTTLTLTVTTGGIASTQTVPFVVHCN